MWWQEMTFIVSILSFLACLHLSVAWERRRFFYILMSLAFLLQIVFYASVLYVKFLDTHTTSSIIRFIQTILFGGWFIMDATEGICRKLSCADQFRNFKKRLSTLWKTE